MKMIWFQACLLILSAVAVHPATVAPSATTGSQSNQPTTSAPDKCHIVAQSCVALSDAPPTKCGPWQIGFVRLNDKLVWNASACSNAYSTFGLTVIQIDPVTCRMLTETTYHTSERVRDALLLADDLRQLDDGTWLIGITGLDAANQLMYALDSLAELGVYVADVGYRGSFTFVVKKGDRSRTSLNKTRDNTVEPASIDVVIAEEITTTPATTIAPTTTPFLPGQVIGCFRDVFGNRDLEHEVEWEVMAGSNTNSMCAAECLTRGYKYAGCQMAVICLCGNNYGAYGYSDGCTLACPGDKTQICGGRLANTVIYTGQGSFKATTTVEMLTTDAVTK